MPPAALAMTTGRAGRAIDEDAQIELALDLQPFLDQHAADLLAFGPGLMRDQRHAEHLLGELLGFVGRLGELDAAALAAAAGVNLRLDDDDVAAEAARDLAGFAPRKTPLRRAARARRSARGLTWPDIRGFSRRVRLQRVGESSNVLRAPGYGLRATGSRGVPRARSPEAGTTSR